MEPIIAHVEAIQTNRAGDRSEKFRVTATYESSNTASSITFDVPMSEAHRYFVGQRLQITIVPSVWHVQLTV